MENIKQQIEELKIKLSDMLCITESCKVAGDKIKSELNKLEQQVNKPTIEVGKVIKLKKDNRVMIMVTGENGSGYGFDCDEDGGNATFDSNEHWHFGSNPELWIEATKEEWETALTKHADKLYEGVEKVDRSCIDISLDPIVKFRPDQDSSFDEDGFMYKGRYVMNSSGVWAKPCEKIDCDLNIQNGRAIFKTPNLEDGKYKLVKVG